MNFIRTFVALTATLAMSAGIASAATATVNSITIPMKALNGSNENGSATLTQVGSAVSVVVTLKNAPATAQPTHIHIGTCGKINASPEFNLLSTVAGKSITSVKGVTLAQLLAGHYAINVHKSAAQLGVYVSCGNIVSK